MRKGRTHGLNVNRRAECLGIPKLVGVLKSSLYREPYIESYEIITDAVAGVMTRRYLRVGANDTQWSC
jgi:hypothetical protein